MIKDVIIPVAVLCFPNKVVGRGRPLLPSISFAVGWTVSVVNPSASLVRFATEAHIQHTTNRKVFWLSHVVGASRTDRPWAGLAVSPNLSILGIWHAFRTQNSK